MGFLFTLTLFVVIDIILKKEKIYKEVQMKEKIKNVVNQIIRISCCIIIILGAFFVGSPLVENFSNVNIVIYFVAIIYLITNCEKKIFINKVDILVFIFCHSLLIPLIFNKALDVEKTIIDLLNNISIFWLYIIVKNLFVTEKQKNILLNTAIISGIFLMILGIDNLTSQTIWNATKEYFNYIQTTNKLNRLFSNFGYPNAVASVAGFGVIISWYKYLKNKNPLYTAAIFIFLCGILLTYSKAMMLIVMIFFVFILIMLKKKNITIESVITFIVIGFLAVIFQKIFDDLFIQKRYNDIWIIFSVMTLISCIVQIFIKKFAYKISNIATKKILVAIGICLVIVIFLIIIVFQIKEPLKLFYTSNSSVQEQRIIYGINPNNKYCLEFDIQAFSKDDRDNNYMIWVSEVNKYYDVVEDHIITFGKKDEVVKLEFDTLEDTCALIIYFMNNNTQSALGLTVNKILINGKEEAPNYKYISTKIIELIEVLKYENKSTSERIAFIKDGFKIIMKTGLVGAGTDCWEKYYPEVQEYKYAARQVHCFPEKVWMEAGIISFISYCVVLGFIVMIMIKQRKNETILFLSMAILILHVHSFIDFCLSFKFIFLLSFIFIGLLNFEDNTPKKNNKYINLLWLPVLIICTFYCMVNYKLSQIRSIRYEQKEKYVKVCPYNNKILDYRFQEILRKEKITIKESKEIKKYLDKKYLYVSNTLNKLIVKCPTEENISYAYEKMKEYQERQTLNLDKRNSLNREILEIAKLLNDTEYKIKFCKLIIDYKEKILSEINNREKNRYSSSMQTMYKNEINNIYEEAKKLLIY